MVNILTFNIWQLSIVHILYSCSLYQVVYQVLFKKVAAEGLRLLYLTKYNCEMFWKQLSKLQQCKNDLSSVSWDNSIPCYIFPGELEITLQDGGDRLSLTFLDITLYGSMAWCQYSQTYSANVAIFCQMFGLAGSVRMRHFNFQVTMSLATSVAI